MHEQYFLYPCVKYYKEIKKKKHTERYRKTQSREEVFIREYAEERNKQRMMKFLVSYNFN